jgi:hypothetical protein
VAIQKVFRVIVTVLSLIITGTSSAAEDTRQLVELPEMMQQHMMANMRDHLAAINEILEHMADGSYDAAADTAESMQRPILPNPDWV